MTGEDFRRRVVRRDGSINQAVFNEIWPKLRVLARCSPKDKYIIIQGCQAYRLPDGRRDIVAMTGAASAWTCSVRDLLCAFVRMSDLVILVVCAIIGGIASLSSVLGWPIILQPMLGTSTRPGPIGRYWVYLAGGVYLPRHMVRGNGLHAGLHFSGVLATCLRRRHVDHDLQLGAIACQRAYSFPRSPRRLVYRVGQTLKATRGQPGV